MPMTVTFLPATLLGLVVIAVLSGAVLVSVALAQAPIPEIAEPGPEDVQRFEYWAEPAKCGANSVDGRWTVTSTYHRETATVEVGIRLLLRGTWLSDDPRTGASPRPDSEDVNAWRTFQYRFDVAWRTDFAVGSMPLFHSVVESRQWTLWVQERELDSDRLTRIYVSDAWLDRLEDGATGFKLGYYVDRPDGEGVRSVRLDLDTTGLAAALAESERCSKTGALADAPPVLVPDAG